MEDDIEKQGSRVLLRPWLENMLASGKIPGLAWHDAEKTMFRIPWKHRSKKDWSIEHFSVFVEWAKNTGRLSNGSKTPNFAQLKTRLRCAFNKAPDIEEMRELHFNYGEEPYRVYRFRNRKDVALQKTKHKAHLPRSSKCLSKKSAEGENLKKFENSVGENNFTDNSNEGLNDEMSYVINKNKEKNNTSAKGADTGMLSNSYHRQTQPDDDPWKAEVAMRLELNKTATDTDAPFIPLSVEMFAASSSSDSDSNRSSPVDLNTFELPDTSCGANSHKVQTNPDQRHQEDFSAVLHRREFEEPNELPLCRSASVVIDNECLATSSNHEVPHQEFSSKEHMLQVASLFVEAGEKITQQVLSSSASKLPLQTTGPLESNNFTVISPRKDEEHNDVFCFSKPQMISELPHVQHETEQDLCYEGHEPAQKTCDADHCANRVKYEETAYDFEFQGESLHPGTDAVDLTYKSYLQDYNEPIDLTKKAFATQFRSKPSQSHQVCPELWRHTDEETLNEEIVNTVLSDIDSEGINFLPTDSIEDIRIKAKQGEQLLVSKAKLLCQWEKRLMRWETELQATEAACYWKNKLLDMELTKNCASIQNDQHRTGITCGSDQRNSRHVVSDSPEVAARLLLPGNGCPQLGLGLQSNIDVLVHPKTVQTFSRNNVSTLLIKQLNNGSSVSSGNSIASVINHTNLSPSKRERSNYRKQCKAVVKERNRKANALPQKNLYVCSVEETGLPGFSLQSPTVLTNNQPSLINLPSGIYKVDSDNNLLCAKTDTFCKEEVNVGDPVDKSKSISDLEVLDCARPFPQPTNEPFLSWSTPSISGPLLPSVGHVSPVSVINSPIDESFDLKESSHRSAGFQRIDFANLPSGTVIGDRRDSDCESGLVIETSDEEEKLVEEDKKKQTRSENCMIRRGSGQEKSENEAQKLTICNKRAVETENLLVEKRLVPMLNTAESAKTGPVPDVPCSFISLNSKVFIPPTSSGNHSHAGHRLEEFTEWLRKKTQMLCKEVSENSANNVPLIDSVQVHEEDNCCSGNSPMTRKRKPSTTNEEEQNAKHSLTYKIS